MLASITPLGERSRGFSWKVTSSAFALGAFTAGAGVGAALGAIGSQLPGGNGWRSVALAVALIMVLIIDATPARTRLPTHRRQVNEDWLGRYRGWVYGAGFGAQLGVGVATIVNSAAIYALPVIEVLSGTAAGGAVIGGVFGVARALPLLRARTARDLDDLRFLHRQLGSLETVVRRAGVVVELVVVLAVIAWVA